MPLPIILAGIGIGGAIALEQAATDFLYGEWSEEKYNTFKSLYSIPGIREYFDYKLDQRKDLEYLYRHQLDWSDIHDPRKLNQTRSYGSTLNYVSRNVVRLYR